MARKKYPYLPVINTTKKSIGTTEGTKVANANVTERKEVEVIGRRVTDTDTRAGARKKVREGNADRNGDAKDVTMIRPYPPNTAQMTNSAMVTIAQKEIATVGGGTAAMTIPPRRNRILPILPRPPILHTPVTFHIEGNIDIDEVTDASPAESLVEQNGTSTAASSSEVVALVGVGSRSSSLSKESPGHNGRFGQ
mmetsp:Transcript_26990/g.79746  ORF Transcript_26990/g.79746 Transcript_26990/m.79746 type:complete len:195 (+) Transcript_26990:1439-2023(+)